MYYKNKKNEEKRLTSSSLLFNCGNLESCQPSRLHNCNHKNKKETGSDHTLILMGPTPTGFFVCGDSSTARLWNNIQTSLRGIRVRLSATFRGHIRTPHSSHTFRERIISRHAYIVPNVILKSMGNTNL